ncbi:MAG: hypothetical protein KDA70_09980 [Planctomycetaceae bacterium]|nr:hypothetical protein [Planctomycetaceae bacterium]
MSQESPPLTELTFISAGFNTFTLKKWFPIATLCFWLTMAFLSSKTVSDWDYEKIRSIVLGIFVALGLFFLARYLVSGFADEVWMNETCIRFQKDGQQETTPLTNIEELKSYHFQLGFPFNFPQYLVRMRFAEPLEMGKQIRFFIRSPAPGGLHHEKEILETLVAHIQNAQANPSTQDSN